MCADYLRLERVISELAEAGVEYMHFDIMDGCFVPNFTFGPGLLNSVRSVTDIPFDIHLMVKQPELHLDSFDIRANDIVSVHQESTAQLRSALYEIRKKGARSGVALSPGTDIHTIESVLEGIDVLLLMAVNPGFSGQKMIPTTLKKISNAKELLQAKRFGAVEIEVDGNVSFENAETMRSAGADIFVAGSSSLFMKDISIADAVARLRFAVK